MRRKIFYVVIIVAIAIYQALTGGLDKFTKTQDNTATHSTTSLMPAGKGNQDNSTQNTSSCERVLANFNQQYLNGQIDVAQLSDIVRTLDKTGQLPSYFVTKKQATSLGWQPGTPFNDIPALQNKSIGGDYFSNFEQRLPKGKWTEADLDYRGNKRNAKRIVFNQEGLRYVSVDHYSHFHKVPTCQ